MSDDFNPELKISIYEDKNLNNNNNNNIINKNKVYDKYLENDVYKDKQPSLEVENVQAEGTFLLPGGNEILKINSDNQYLNMTQAFQEPSDLFSHIEDNDNQKSFRPPKERSDIFDKDFINFNFESDNQKILKKLTVELVDTYKLCNVEYQYTVEANPKRVLTQPSIPAHNNGNDNENYDYILYINDIIGEKDRQYLIIDLFGKGTFGQVVKCKNLKTGEYVALKVIKNKPAYLNQSKIEVSILDMLNNYYDKNNEHHIVRVTDSFMFKNHLCIVFEELNKNLYEVLKQQNYYGLSTQLNCIYISQILDCLSLLSKARVIHCDLKPENILIDNNNPQFIKVIDFGSACYGNHLGGSYIQSRFYRSIEVLLGYPYTNAIDMWSLGCITAELFIGLPIFPGTSEYEQIQLIVNLLGVPPTYLIEKSKNGKKFFERVGIQKGQPIYKFKEKYSKKMEKESNYTNKGKTLEEVIQLGLTQRRNIPKEDMKRDIARLPALIDFLRGLLNLDPQKRWTPDQAKKHPFLTGEEYTGPYIPVREPVLPNPNRNITPKNFNSAANIQTSSTESINSNNNNSDATTNLSSNNSSSESRVSRIEKKLKSRSLKNIPKIKDLHPKIQKFISKYSNNSENKINGLKSKESIEKEKEREKNGLFKIKKIDKNNKLVLVNHKKDSKESIGSNASQEDLADNSSYDEDDLISDESDEEPINILQVDFNKVTLDDRNSNSAMNQIPPPVPLKDNVPSKLIGKTSKDTKPILPEKDTIKPEQSLSSKDENTSRISINLDNFAHIKELDDHKLSRLSISMENFNISSDNFIADSNEYLTVDNTHSLNRRRKSDNELRLSTYGFNSDNHNEKNGYYINDTAKATLTRQYSLLSNTSSTRSFPSLPRIPNGGLGLDIDMNAEFDNYNKHVPAYGSNLQKATTSDQYGQSDHAASVNEETKIMINSNNTDTNDLSSPEEVNVSHLKSGKEDQSYFEQHYDDSKVYNDEIYHSKVYKEKIYNASDYDHDHDDQVNNTSAYYNYSDPTIKNYFDVNDEDENDETNDMLVNNISKYPDNNFNEVNDDLIEMEEGRSRRYSEDKRNQTNNIYDHTIYSKSYDPYQGKLEHNHNIYSEEEGNFDRPVLNHKISSNSNRINDNGSLYHEKIYTSSIDNYNVQSNRTNSYYNDNTNRSTFDHDSISNNDYSDYYNKNQDPENIILTIDQQDEENINYARRHSSYNPSLNANDQYQYAGFSRNRSNTINTNSTLLTTNSDSNYNIDVPLPQNTSDDSFSKLINSEHQDFMNYGQQGDQKDQTNTQDPTHHDSQYYDYQDSQYNQYGHHTDQEISIHEDITNSEINQPISPIIISQPTTSLLSLNVYRLPPDGPVARARSSSIVRHKYNNLISSHDNVYDNNNLANNTYTFDYPTTNSYSHNNSTSNNSLYYSQQQDQSNDGVYNDGYSRDTRDTGDHSTIKEKKSAYDLMDNSGIDHDDTETSRFYNEIYDSMYKNDYQKRNDSSFIGKNTNKSHTDFKIDIETQESSRRILGTFSHSTPATPSGPGPLMTYTTTSTPNKENYINFDTIPSPSKSNDTPIATKSSNSHYSMSKNASDDNIYNLSKNLDYSYDMNYKLDFSNTLLDTDPSPGEAKDAQPSVLVFEEGLGSREGEVHDRKSYPSSNSIHNISVYNNTTIKVDAGKEDNILDPDMSKYSRNTSGYFSQSASAMVDHIASNGNNDSHINIDISSGGGHNQRISPSIPSSYPNETLHYNNIDVDATPTNHLSLKRHDTTKTNTSSVYMDNKRSSSSVFLPTYNILNTPILPYQLDNASIFSGSEISSIPSPPMNSTTINITDSGNTSSLPRSYSTNSANLMNSSSQPQPPDTLNRRVSLTRSSISSNSINFYPSSTPNNNVNNATATSTGNVNTSSSNYTSSNPINTNNDLFEKPRERSKSYQYNSTTRRNDDMSYGFPLPPTVQQTSADSIHSITNTGQPSHAVHPSTSSTSSSNKMEAFPPPSLPIIDRNSSFRKSHPMINYNNTFFGLPPEQRYVSSSSAAALPPPPPSHPMSSSQDLHSSANTSTGSIHHKSRSSHDNSILPTHYTSTGNPNNASFISHQQQKQQLPPPQGVDPNYPQKLYHSNSHSHSKHNLDFNDNLDLNIKIGQ